MAMWRSCRRCWRREPAPPSSTTPAGMPAAGPPKAASPASSRRSNAPPIRRSGDAFAFYPGRASEGLSRSADRGLLDVVADIGLERDEIVLEPFGQVARRLVISLLVAPGAARVEDVGRNVGAAFRHQEPEIRVLAHRRRGEPAVERGPQKPAGMRDRHPLAD